MKARQNLVVFVVVVLVALISASCGGISTEQPRMLVAVAFLDVVGIGGYHCFGCDGIFSGADWFFELDTPFPSGQVVFILWDKDGVETRQTAVKEPDSQFAKATFVIKPEGSPYTLRLSQGPGLPLVSCPNSPLERKIEVDFFDPQRRVTEIFPFWWGCPWPPFPTKTPTPEKVPTDTPTPLPQRRG